MRKDNQSILEEIRTSAKISSSGSEKYSSDVEAKQDELLLTENKRLTEQVTFWKRQYNEAHKTARLRVYILSIVWLLAIATLICYSVCLSLQYSEFNQDFVIKVIESLSWLSLTIFIVIALKFLESDFFKELFLTIKKK